MYCRYCGIKLPDDARVCPNCGTPVWVPPEAEQSSAPMPEAEPEAVSAPGSGSVPEPAGAAESAYAPSPVPEPSPSPVPGAGSSGAVPGDNIGIPVKVIAITGMVLYIFWSLQAFVNVFSYVFSLFLYPYKIPTILFLLGSMLALASCVIMVFALLLLAARTTKENSEYVFMTVCAAGAIRVLAAFLRMLLIYIGRLIRGTAITVSPLTTFIRAAVYALIVVGVVFAVLYASGNHVLAGRTSSEITDMIKDLPTFLSDEMDALTQQTEYAPRRMRTDRSFILILLLGLITCGIYNFYVYYTISRDLNIMCEGDGKKTMGILPHVLLSIVTCGIFEYYWQYAAAERMADNGPRFGANIHEGGSTILLWMLIGTFVCCLGSYFAIYFQIKNMNTLSAAYNRALFGDQ